MGEGAAKQGGTFAANLSREGEKANYDYIVRWVHNPRQRSAPYCSFEKKDLTAEDYQRHGLPYVFDLEHSKCPNDGHELQVQQMTPMPSLRLTEDEARDIATYLMTRKHDNATYANADFMDDPNLKNQGLALVRNYGCASCHEIAGLEEEQRIGTELTKEGSKPIERLDFALLGHEAEREDWYTHKGFFEHKLKDPAVYDTGKEKAKQDRLKMPNFNLSKPEIDAVTTFLTGSVDASVPARYFYNPTDARQDIIDGWWVVRKYNCMGCHRVHVGQTTTFDAMTKYQDPDWKDQQPPTLIGEGARVNPEWLMRFLNNPALSETDTNRDGVRQYLKARMPTFSFSDGEIRKLVRFFEALSSQAQPFIAEKLEPLTDDRAHHGAQSVHQRRRALLEVPHDRRRQARCPRHGAEFHGGARAFEAGLDQALDAGSGADESGDGDAERAVPAGWRALRVHRSDAAEFQRIYQRPRGSAGPLHVPVHTGRVGAFAQQRGRAVVVVRTRGSKD